MNIQLYQLITLAIYILLGFLAYKASKRDSGYLFGAIIALMLIIFFVNPLRHKQQGGESLERGVTRFDELPSKVVVEKEGFNESQARELKALKQQSEDRKNEVHN